MNYDEARNAAREFVRSLSDQAPTKLWEVSGHRDTMVRAIQCWDVRVPGDRPRLVLVEVLDDRRGGGGSGWMVFPEIGPNEIEGTRACMLGLGAYEKAPAHHPSALAVIAAEVLAYQAAQFDAECLECTPATRAECEMCEGTGFDHDRDLSVSGADLVDAFSEWRPRLRAALEASAQPAKVWAVEGSHWDAPPRRLILCATRAGADAEAAKLVNIFLRDMGMRPLAKANNWPEELARVQARRKEDGLDESDPDMGESPDCWVEVNEEPVNA
jgi:hypothetical protein